MGQVIHKLKQYIEYKGVTVRSLEESSSMSQGLFGKILKNNGSLGSDKLENILHAFPDLNPNWLFRNQGPMILDDKGMVFHASAEEQGEYRTRKGVPLYDMEATAGTVTLFDDLMNQGPIAEISIPDLPKCDGAIYIRGDSMYPILKSGDIVVYKVVHDKEHFFWGEMYLLSLNIEGDSMVMVKYVQKSPKEGYIRLVSHNPNHQDKNVPLENVLSFAIIKVSIRRNTI